MYSGAKADELHLLKKAEVGRFCDVIQRQQPEYTRYFVLVFQNKTFRVYQVLWRRWQTLKPFWNFLFYFLEEGNSFLVLEWTRCNLEN